MAESVEKVRELKDELQEKANQLKEERNNLHKKSKLLAEERDAYNSTIRKIRNEIKASPSNIKFRLHTNRIESYANIPIKSSEVELIQYLDIENRDEALKNNAYNCVFILDVYFPDMLQFWNECFSIFKTDLALTSGST